MTGARRNPRRAGSRALATLLGVLGVTTLFLTGSGLGGPSTTASGITTAPFRGGAFSGSYTLNPLLAGACGFAQLSHPIVWHNGSGRGGWAERVRAVGGPACTGANGSSYAAYPVATATLTVAVPIGSPTASGLHNVTANWTLRYTAKWDESHGGCPKVVLVNGSGYEDCSVQVGFTLQSYGFPHLIDLSTGNFVPSYSVFTLANGTQWVRDMRCGPGNASGPACTNLSVTTSDPKATITETYAHPFYWNQTYLNASHSYAVVCTFLGSVYANTQAYPRPWSANATASLNLEGYGDALTLDSVTIT